MSDYSVSDFLDKLIGFHEQSYTGARWIRTNQYFKNTCFTTADALIKEYKVDEEQVGSVANDLFFAILDKEKIYIALGECFKIFKVEDILIPYETFWNGQYWGVFVDGIVKEYIKYRKTKKHQDAKDAINRNKNFKKDLLLLTEEECREILEEAYEEEVEENTTIDSLRIEILTLCKVNEEFKDHVNELIEEHKQAAKTTITPIIKSGVTEQDLFDIPENKIKELLNSVIPDAANNKSKKENIYALFVMSNLVEGFSDILQQAVEKCRNTNNNNNINTANNKKKQ